MSLHSEPQICLRELSCLHTEAVILQKLLCLVTEETVWALISSPVVARESTKLRSVWVRGNKETVNKGPIKNNPEPRAARKERGSKFSHWALEESNEQRKACMRISGC